MSLLDETAGCTVWVYILTLGLTLGRETCLICLKISKGLHTQLKRLRITLPHPKLVFDLSPSPLSTHTYKEKHLISNMTNMIKKQYLISEMSIARKPLVSIKIHRLTCTFCQRQTDFVIWVPTFLISPVVKTIYSVCIT